MSLIDAAIDYVYSLFRDNAAALAARDWQTAGRLLLASMESVITGPTAII